MACISLSTMTEYEKMGVVYDQYGLDESNHTPAAHESNDVGYPVVLHFRVSNTIRLDVKACIGFTPSS